MWTDRTVTGFSNTMGGGGGVGLAARPLSNSKVLPKRERKRGREEDLWDPDPGCTESREKCIRVHPLPIIRKSVKGKTQPLPRTFSPSVLQPSPVCPSSNKITRRSERSSRALTLSLLTIRPENRRHIGTNFVPYRDPEVVDVTMYFGSNLYVCKD